MRASIPAEPADDGVAAVAGAAGAAAGAVAAGAVGEPCGGWPAIWFVFWIICCWIDGSCRANEPNICCHHTLSWPNGTWLSPALVINSLTLANPPPFGAMKYIIPSRSLDAPGVIKFCNLLSAVCNNPPVCAASVSDKTPELMTDSTNTYDKGALPN